MGFCVWFWASSRGFRVGIWIWVIFVFPRNTCIVQFKFTTHLYATCLSIRQVESQSCAKNMRISETKLKVKGEIVVFSGKALLSPVALPLKSHTRSNILKVWELPCQKIINRRPTSSLNATTALIVFFSRAPTCR